MAESLSELKKKLEELTKEYSKLAGKKIEPVNVQTLEQANSQIKIMEEAIARAQEKAYRLQEGFAGVYGELEAIVGEIGKQEDATKKALKPLRSSEDIARKMRNDQEGISRLSARELKRLKEKNLENKAEASFQAQKLAKEKGIVDLSNTNLRFRRDLTESEYALLKAEQDSFGVLEDTNDLIDKRLKKEREIQRTIGLTGQAFKGLSNTLTKIGIDSQAIDDINEDIYETAEKTGNSFKTMGTAISGTAKLLKDSLLNDAAVQLIVIQKIYSAIYNILSSASKTSFELSQNLATSNKNAFQLQMELRQFAIYAEEGSTTFSRLVEANNNLNNALGTSVRFTQQQLETQSKLINVVGLSAEESAKVLEYSLLTGQSQEQIVDNVRTQGKGLINANLVLKEVAATSGRIAANYANNPKAIAEAVYQSRRLGLSLDETRGISDSLLDFESSISSELEAELLTGRQLNFERARALALQGKTAEAAAEVRKQVGSLADFQKLNVIQQNAIAKAAGMTTDQLADSLRKEEQLKQIAKDKNIPLEKAAKLEEQREAAAQRLANAGDRIKTAFTDLTIKYLTPLLEKMADFVENITSGGSNSFMGAIKGIGGALTGIGALGSVFLGLRTLFGGRRGSKPGKPMWVTIVGAWKEMGTLGKNISKSVSGVVGKSVKSLSSLVGGKKTIAGRALRGVAAKKIAKSAGKTATTLGAKTATKTGGKVAAKLGAKALGKGLLKKIPGVGLLAGIGFGLQRALKGDLAGAALELASGAASTLPGLGTAASVGLDAALAARDIKQATSTPTPMATGGVVTQPVNAIVGEAGPEAVIPLNEFYKKFDELISVIKEGGDVYIDGSKVGKTLQLASSRMG